MNEALEKRIEQITDITKQVNETIKEIKESSDKDLEIDECDLDSEALRTPKLYSKYNNMYTDELVKLKRLFQSKEKTHLERYKYYLGKQTNKYYSEYGQFNEKVLKTEIETYMKADPIMVELNILISTQKVLADMLERICKEISNRGYHIKSAIEWRRFQVGG